MGQALSVNLHFVTNSTRVALSTWALRTKRRRKEEKKKKWRFPQISIQFVDTRRPPCTYMCLASKISHPLWLAFLARIQSTPSTELDYGIWWSMGPNIIIEKASDGYTLYTRRHPSSVTKSSCCCPHCGRRRGGRRGRRRRRGIIPV